MIPVIATDSSDRGPGGRQTASLPSVARTWGDSSLSMEEARVDVVEAEEEEGEEEEEEEEEEEKGRDVEEVEEADEGAWNRQGKSEGNGPSITVSANEPCLIDAAKETDEFPFLLSLLEFVVWSLKCEGVAML